MRILIELPTWLGDSVMLTPAIENIVRHYKKPEITIIGSNVSVQALKSHPNIINTEVINKDYKSLYKIARFFGYFDAFFSFRSSLRSSIFKLFLSSKYKYQFNKNQYQNCHQVEKYNHFVNNCLNTNYSADKLTIYSTKKASLCTSLPTIGINPGASYGEAKRWYPREFADVAHALSNKYDIIIFGGSKEKDIARDIERYLINYGVNNYQNLAGKTSITDLINQISNLDLFITGDSGPMHIAAAFQVPTITIFGPTNDKETSQWMNQNSIILKKSLECQPCMKRNCPLKHHNCMTLIKSIDVLKAIK
ncbi:MAG: lipopolysaccharide heptosyltransferase II, partial [Candidatus Marinimicrobia bacterium]|nr:lipopolysaccharide heptosyltransferase II [Candidatus Neomarinimicrobiota bacterium]